MEEPQEAVRLDTKMTADNNVFSLAEVGRVERGNFTFGNCVRKLFYRLSGLEPEIKDLTSSINLGILGGSGPILGYKGIKLRLSTYTKDTCCILDQVVWGQLASDMGSDEKLRSTRFFGNFSWYPIVHIWALRLLGVKKPVIYWRLFDIEGGISTLVITDDSEGNIYCNGSKTSMNLLNVDKAMDVVISTIKLDYASDVKPNLPKRDFSLIYDKDTIDRLMSNTVSTKVRPFSNYAIMPLDFSLPYLVKYLYAQVHKKSDPVDRYGKVGDQECRTCPFQKACYGLDERFPSAGKRRLMTRAMTAIHQQRLDLLRYKGNT